MSVNAITNPITNPGEAKITEMKKEQEEKRISLFNIVKEYKAQYKAQEKKCAEAQQLFLIQQQELNKHDETERKYDEYKADFQTAKHTFMKERNQKDLKLSLFQFRSDIYVKASRLNILDLA